MGKHYACTLNAAVGNERDCEIRKAEKSKRVVIVGGGPSGLEAARVAALRGHEVYLLEKNNQLGGQMVLGAVPPHTEEVKNTIRYFTNEMGRLGVKVMLNVEATPATIQELKPEVVVVATGAEELIPEMKGARAGNVVTAWDVLRGANVNGQKIAMLGGGLVGCEVAELLAEQGKSVIVVEMLPDIAGDMNTVSRKYLLERFSKNGIQVLTDAKVQEITPEGIVWIDKKGSKRDLKADTAILAFGAVANERLAKELDGRVPEIHLIGDCRSPRTIRDAVHEGFHCGNQI
jgi:NADPH-dependent 2,4-dienoyl-CoA reductase/sulfur reductase-like enzyme